jgi:hypothetical protein
MMNPEDILNRVRLRLDGFEPLSEPLPLSGGLDQLCMAYKEKVAKHRREFCTIVCGCVA